MLSFRRHKLLGLRSGQSSFVAPFTLVSDHGQHTESLAENSEPVSERLLLSNDGFTLKKEMTSEYNHSLLEVSATSFLKANAFQSNPGLPASLRDEESKVHGDSGTKESPHQALSSFITTKCPSWHRRGYKNCSSRILFYMCPQVGMIVTYF